MIPAYYHIANCVGYAILIWMLTFIFLGAGSDFETRHFRAVLMVASIFSVACFLIFL